MRHSTWAELLLARATDAPDELAFEISVDGDTAGPSLTYAGLDRAARSVAAEIARQQFASGARALLLCPPGLDFIAALFGCFYAGVVAVPVHPPGARGSPRTLGRFGAILTDAQPSLLLTTSALQPVLEALSPEFPVLPTIPWVAIDALGEGLASVWRRPCIDADSLALLQYTSGSTASPRGVVLTHGNLLHNCAVIDRAFGVSRQDSRLVTWLPPYHDMGLIGCVLEPVFGGCPTTLMPPSAFLQRPVRWLRAISRAGATLSGGPNFAYEMCVRRGSAQEWAGLDLSRWRLAFNGAEPVRAETLDHFAATFAPYGFDRRAFRPCYGLAEASLFVAGVPAADPPTIREYLASSLEPTRRVERHSAGEMSRMLVGCGRVDPETRVAIVDPVSGEPCEPCHVGEIWVQGESVALGYFGRRDETARTFEAVLSDGCGGRFLRTGDLGFLDGDELFVTGRLKDLVIVRGVNHYPQDIEATAGRSHPAVYPDGCVAFGVDAEGEERLAIVVELTRAGRASDPDAIFSAVRRRVVEEHGVDVYAVVSIAPGTLPRTSSGKVQRHACRSAFIDGTLKIVARSQVVAPADVEAARAPEVARRSSTTPLASQPDGTAIRQWLVERVSAAVGVSADQVDTREPLARYGLDSVKAVALAGSLETWLGRPLPATLAYEYPTIDALARHLGMTPETPLQREQAETPPSGDEPIAIIGIGCRFPMAEGPEAFWRLLADGVDAVREVPADRWDADAYFDADPASPGMTNTRWGGFLDAVDQFDAHFFGISPHEAARMDPQQRLLLEVAVEAVDDAGLTREKLTGTRSGVFIGIATGDYSQLQWHDLTQIDGYASTGNAFSIAANRLSYFFDLHGPSLAVDTACSSSLVAVHLACESLRRGESTLALAGGANVILSPGVAIGFTKAGVMSPDGRCRTFDARANGYVRGEGAAIVVLKRLSLAIADGDRVYAVVRGSAVGQDGRTNGILAPNRFAQEAVLRDAYARAAVSPGEVQYVEAHGTGTLLGDPIEASALGSVVGELRGDDRPCLIGSVKTNLGHLEAAAGIAGLIKVALALQHRTIPPSLHFERGNPHIAFDALRLRVASGLEPWPETRRSLLAGVSSFGFGGTNAHAVLEDATPSPSRDPAEPAEGPAYLLPISARTPEALRHLARRFAGFLTMEPEARRLRDICYTASVRRTHHESRFAVQGTTREALAERLAAFAAAPADAAGARPLREVPPSVVFVFPGQGSQSVGMGRDLLDREPVFRRTIEACDSAMAPYLEWSLLHAFRDETLDARLDDMAVIQPMLCALHVALAALWRSWGIEPAAVVGHSLGEVAAAHVAGALTLDDAARIVCLRSRLFRRLSGTGGMVAVDLSPKGAEEILGAYAGRVSVAAVNSRSSTVIAGAPAALDEVVAALEQRQVFCRRLSANVPSHTAGVEPLREDLARVLQGVAPRPTAIPFISSVAGHRIDGEALDAGYWWRNMRQPVLFASAADQLFDAGHRIFVELSPHPSLLGALQEISDERGCEAVLLPSLRRGTAGDSSLRASLAALYAQGCEIRWENLLPGGGRVVSLPSYPWQRERCWFEADAIGRQQAVPRPPPARSRPTGLLGPCLRTADSATSYWETQIDARSLPIAAEHRIEGAAVVPAAAYVEMVLAALDERGQPGPHVLMNVQFHRALVLDEGEPQWLQLALTDRTFGIYSRADSAGSAAPWILHASGSIADAAEADAAMPAEPRLDVLKERCREEVSIGGHYEALAQRGLEYGPALRRMTRAWRSDRDALGELDPEASVWGTPEGRAAVADASLQLISVLELRSSQLTDSRLYVPTHIDRVSAYDRSAAAAWAHVDGMPALDVAGGHAIRASVRQFDHAGQIVADFQGVRLEQIGGSAVSPAWSVAQREYLYAVQWREWTQPAARAPVARPSATSPRRWLILADRPGVGRAVATYLEARGDHVTVASVGDAVSEALRDAAGPEHSLAGVVHLHGLDTPPENATQAAELGDVHVVACDSALTVTRALVSATWQVVPRLWLVTRGAASVGHASCAIAVAAAGLWGLGRAIALEYPQLGCAVVDLDPAAGGDAAAETLCHELDRASDGDDEAAWRGGMRYVRRLARYGPRTDLQRRLVPMPGRLGIVGRPVSARLLPRPGEVEIDVVAAGVNFRDVLFATGIDASLQCGFECAGRVTRVGEGVDALAVGDRVMALASDAFAPFVTTAAALTVPIPPTLTFEEAATVPVAFLTALYGLRRVARLGHGERVLIHTASGGVGLAAVQVARLAGAEIFATAGTPERRAFLRSLGITHVFSSRTLEFADRIRQVTGGEGIDVVLNTLPGEFLVKSLALVAPYGRFVEIGRTDIVRSTPIGLDLLTNGISFTAVDLDHLARKRPGVLRDVFAEVLDELLAGRLTPLPRQVFPAAQASEALEYMIERRHIGKIVLGFEAACPPNATSTARRVRPDATYVVTGGMGGVGLSIAKWLVDRGARHLALVGRRPPGETAAGIVTTLKEAGAEINTFAADVASSDQVAEVLAGIRRTMPPLRGVVHAAGVLDDGTVVQLDRDRLTRVLRPKVDGAWNLHRHTLDDPLEFFVMCSSAASVLGSPGQSSYCAGNACLDALAHERRRQGRPASAINWGPWSDVGLAAAPERSGRLAPYGIGSLAPDEALVVLDLMLEEDPGQLVALRADWAQFRAAVGPTSPAASFVSKLAVASVGTVQPASASGHIRQAILTAEQSEVAHLLTKYLLEQSARVLGLPAAKLEADRRLGTLGLDSLMAVQLKNRIEADLGLTVPIVTLVQGPSVAQLAARLQELLAIRSRPLPGTEPAAESGLIPLTLEQERMWLADRLDPGNPAFKVPIGICLHGLLDIRALEKSLREVVSRHEALRTTFIESAGQPAQIVNAKAALALTVVDLCHLPERERETEARRIAVAEVQRRLDLATGPLFSAVVVRLATDWHVLVLASHHIIGDGWSLAVLLEEIAALYGAFEQGQPSPLPPPAQQYRDFVRRHRLRQQSPAIEVDVAYWRRKLAGAPGLLELPTDRQRPLVQSFRGHSVTLDLPAGLAAGVDALVRGESATRFMALLAAFYVVLHRYSGQTDVVVGSPVAGRDYPGTEGLVGLVANVLALRADLSGDPTFREVLARVRAVALEAYAHQDLPFRRVVEAAHPARRTTYPPLFQVMLTNPPPLMTHKAGGLTLSPFEFSGGTSVFDLLLIVVEAPNGLRARLEGNTDLFDVETIAQLLDAYRDVLARGLCEPDTRLSRFGLPAGLEAKATLARAHQHRSTVAVASTFPVEPVGEVLGFWFDELALALVVEEAPFNQVFQQLLDPASLLSTNRDGINVVLVRAEDWRNELDRNAREFIAALNSAASRSAVPHVVCVCPASARASDGATDDATTRLEALLSDALRDLPAVHLITVAELATRYPIPGPDAAAVDALAPVSLLYFTAIGTMVARRIHALKTPRAKVIAVDCDGTLWQGTCGEDGPDGIVIDRASAALQASLVACHERGMLICLCSRNNEEDVFEVFDTRPEMVLQREHLAAWRINWEDKSENLAALADALNVGIDSIVFVDDDPVVCDETRMRHPEVTTIRRPEDDEGVGRLLSHVWSLDRVSVTAEDASRTTLYRREIERKRALDASPSLAAFLESLQLQVRVSPLATEQLARASQLTWRTNQFNTTTVRRTEAELGQCLASPADLCLGVEVTDRFGDYGLVGLVLARTVGESLEVAAFLLSCRALGRAVEHRVLQHLLRIAGDRGLDRVAIRFVPTKKNRPAREFLERLAGAEIRRSGDAMVFTIRSGSVIAVPAAETRTSIDTRGRDIPIAGDAAVSAARIARIATMFQRLDAIQDAVATQRSRRPRSQAQAAFVAPRTATERLLAGLWSRALQVEAIGIDDNFFDLGGHSFLAARLVHELRQSVDVDIPLRRVFEHPTIRSLAAMLDGSSVPAASADARVAALAADARLDPAIRPAGSFAATSATLDRVLLTGATGFLGAFVLSELLDRTSADIVCLVRGAEEDDALKRIARQFAVCGLDPARLQQRVVPLVGDLGRPGLGLVPSAFAALAESLDAIYHAGAIVNFAHTYSTLRAPNVLGTQEVIRLASASRTKPLHYVSTLGVLGTTSARDEAGRLVERDSSNPYDGMEVGYFETKWVAEKLVLEARERGLPASIFRPGIVAGDSRRGFAPPTDLAARLMQLLIRLESAPDVDFSLEMTPVDFVARAIVHVSQQPHSLGQIFHVCGPARTGFSDLVSWIEASGYPLRRLRLDEWQDELRARAPEHAWVLGLFDFASAAGGAFAYDHRNLDAMLAGSTIACPPIDARLVARYIRHLPPVDTEPVL